jgi:hypothetical protein
MSTATLMHSVKAESNLCVVTTFVYADSEEQAERMGLEQIKNELGITNTEMFIDIEVECEEQE